jgi:hypothetical protein
MRALSHLIQARDSCLNKFQSVKKILISIK